MANDVDDVFVEAHRLVGEKVRARITGVSRSGWNILEKRSRETGRREVPDRVVLTPGKTAWRLAELVEWVKSRPTYAGGHLSVQAAKAAAMAEAGA